MAAPKAKNGKTLFNEATKVQMPALVHLTRLGYEYFGKINEDMAGVVYDSSTNILTNVFKNQFERLNSDEAGNFEEILRQIRQELGKANNIPFTCQECTASEPCAGTCAQCDAEAAYLNEQMQQKAPEERVYPRHIFQKWEGSA